MAQKRMLDKKISVSDQVGNLPVEGQLIFTWAIPHADDIGLLPHSFRTLKAIIAPLLEMRVEDFEKVWIKIMEQGLVEEFSHEGEKFFRLVKFNGHQTLKKDRQPQTIMNFEYCPTPRDSWVKLSNMGFHLEDVGNQIVPEVKLSEVKRSEVNKIQAAPQPQKALNQEFFSQGEIYKTYFEEFAAKVTPSLVEREFKKFHIYWTELNPSGKKQRWELQKTFEVKRRLLTWFTNVRGPSAVRDFSRGRGLA